MKIIEIEDRTDSLLAELLELWEKSVRATHLFLNESDIQNIKKYVPEALKNVPHLIIAADSQNKPLAFMGIADNTQNYLYPLCFIEIINSLRTSPELIVTDNYSIIYPVNQNSIATG